MTAFKIPSNNLLTSSDSGTNALNINKSNHDLTEFHLVYLGLNPCEKRCRLITFLLCFLLFITAFVVFVVLVILPKGYSQMAMVQESATTLLATVNSYYFDVKITRNKTSPMNDVNISIVPCSDIQTYIVSHIGKGQAIGPKHQQLHKLNEFAYLVSGSLISIEVNISLSSLSPTEAVYFYMFTNWNSYESFDQIQTIPVNYFKRFNVSAVQNDSTIVTFPVTTTGYYFYGLSIPNEANYHYTFNIKQVRYNSSVTKCQLSSTMLSCFLHLDAIHYNEELCILSYCTGSNYTFYSVQSDLVKRTLNSISASVMTFMLVLFFLVFAILLYDAYRRYFDPKFSSCSCKCK